MPQTHSESTTKPSGKRKIMVTLPNMNIASVDFSNRDKFKHAKMPNIGHGSMTASEAQKARSGKLTGVASSGSIAGKELTS